MLSNGKVGKNNASPASIPAIPQAPSKNVPIIKQANRSTLKILTRTLTRNTLKIKSRCRSASLRPNGLRY